MPSLVYCAAFVLLAALHSPDHEAKLEGFHLCSPLCGKHVHFIYGGHGN
jgi:hypothetical protein